MYFISTHQLGLHWKLSKRKCESSNMMEYVSKDSHPKTKQWIHIIILLFVYNIVTKFRMGFGTNTDSVVLIEDLISFSSIGDSYRILIQISYIPTRLRWLSWDWMYGPWILSLVPCIYVGIRVCTGILWWPHTSPRTLYIRICNTVTLL